MGRRGVWFILILGIFFVSSVNAIGPTFERHTGCSDPALDWAAQGYSQCVEVISCAGDDPDLDDPAHGTLDTDNTYYLLMNDITSNKTCIWYESNNSVFDLNNYTIQFGEAGVNGIPNNDFEIAGASEQLPANWDFSSAPTAYRYADDYISLVNNYLIRFDNIASIETISSDWIWLNVTDRTYEGFAAFTCVSNRSVEVEREGTGTVCESVGDNGECSFTVSTPGRYRLKINVWEGSPTETTNCRVDYADIRPTYDMGIVLPNFYLSASSFPDYASVHDPPDKVSTSVGYIKNGKIIEPERGSSFGRSIYTSFPQTTIENIYTENHGYDSYNFYGDYGVILRNSTLLNTNPWTRNRHQLYGPVNFDHGDNLVYNNNFSGGQGNLFFPGTNTAPYPSGNKVYNNVFYNNMTAVTNHYMVVMYHETEVEIYNNTFLGSAPAILFSGHTSNSQAHDNFFNLTTMPCNAEYPRGYSTSAFRLTDYGNVDSTKNNQVYNNVVYGTGIFYPDHPQCFPSIRGFHLSTSSANNTYFNNYVNLTALGSNSYAYVVHQGYSDGGYFYNNTFSSNHFIAWLGNDYAEYSSNIIFDSNNFYQNGNEARFHTIAFGYCCAPESSLNHTFLNNSYFGGASIEDMYPNCNDHSTDFDYTVKWYLDVNVYDGGTPLAGLNVDVHSTPQNQDTVLQTDTSGLARFNLTEFYAYSPDVYYAAPAPWQYTNYSPYNISVTYLGETQSQVVNLDSSQTVSFYFGGTSPDVNSDGTINIKDLALEVYWQGKQNTDGDWNWFTHLDLNEDGVVNFEDVLEIVMGV